MSVAESQPPASLPAKALVVLAIPADRLCLAHGSYPSSHKTKPNWCDRMANYTPTGPASSSPLKSVRSPPVSSSRNLSAKGLSSVDKFGGPSETSAPVGDAAGSTRKASSSTAVAAPPARPGTYSFVVAGTNFQIDDKYKFVKVIGRGAYGVVVSAENTETNEKVAELIFEEILRIHPDAPRSPLKSSNAGISSPPTEQVLSPSTTRSHTQD
ncbi:hypothetical protein PC122_g14143 [Phytophthora cactorum]|nr:hypothetical protein PC122_g14143 [Phytophthora cactorum]